MNYHTRESAQRRPAAEKVLCRPPPRQLAVSPFTFFKHKNMFWRFFTPMNLKCPRSPQKYGHPMLTAC